MSDHHAGEYQRIFVWDLPTRIFHWLLVASFVGAWLTYDDNRYLYAHTFAGYTFFGLLSFRLLWGMAGSRHAPRPQGADEARQDGPEIRGRNL